MSSILNFYYTFWDCTCVEGVMLLLWMGPWWLRLLNILRYDSDSFGYIVSTVSSTLVDFWSCGDVLELSFLLRWAGDYGCLICWEKNSRKESCLSPWDMLFTQLQLIYN